MDTETLTLALTRVWWHLGRGLREGCGDGRQSPHKEAPALSALLVSPGGGILGMSLRRLRPWRCRGLGFPLDSASVSTGPLWVARVATPVEPVRTLRLRVTRLGLRLGGAWGSISLDQGVG